jgi:hypothetical protein
MNHLPNLILAQPALSLVMVIFFWPVVLSSAETFRIRLLASRCQSKQLSEEHPWVQEELMPESSNLPSRLLSEEQEQMDTLLAGRWLSEYEEKTAAPIGDPLNQNNHDNAYNN